MNNDNQALITELEKLLRGGTAHVGFEDAIADLPEALLGQTPENLPYSIWQLVEHIRIAQADMLDFSRNPDYKALNWPADYWPKETAPENKAAFEGSVNPSRMTWKLSYNCFIKEICTPLFHMAKDKPFCGRPYRLQIIPLIMLQRSLLSGDCLTPGNKCLNLGTEASEQVNSRQGFRSSGV